MIKLKEANFPPAMPDNPISTRDRLMKECWCEIKGLPKPVWEDVWDGPLEPRIEILKQKMKAYEEKAQKMKEEYDKEQASKPAEPEKKKTT